MPTDRQRLRTAMRQLSKRGYLAQPFRWQGPCCSNCGWADIQQMCGYPRARDDAPDDWDYSIKCCWWNAQSDSYAFTGDAGRCIERLRDHPVLVNELHLHWRSNGEGPDEIVEVLRGAGFDVREPKDITETIGVLPARE